MVTKFNIGDHVKILDGNKIENYSGGWVPAMNRFIGKVDTIHSITITSDGVRYDLEKTGYVFDERGLETASADDIKDNVDDFDIYKGNNAAPYNGKIVFTRGDKTFPTGVVFEIKDGKMKYRDDRNEIQTIPVGKCKFTSFKDVVDYFSIDGIESPIGARWSSYDLMVSEVKKSGNDLFKVGDIVEIKNKDKCYQTYVGWVNAIDVCMGDRLRFDYGQSPDVNVAHKILAIRNRQERKSDILFYVKNLQTGRCYIVNQKGVGTW